MACPGHIGSPLAGAEHPETASEGKLDVAASGQFSESEHAGLLLAAIERAEDQSILLTLVAAGL